MEFHVNYNVKCPHRNVMDARNDAKRNSNRNIYVYSGRIFNVSYYAKSVEILINEIPLSIFLMLTFSEMCDSVMAFVITWIYTHKASLMIQPIETSY